MNKPTLADLLLTALSVPFTVAGVLATGALLACTAAVVLLFDKPRKQPEFLPEELAGPLD